MRVALVAAWIVSVLLVGCASSKERKAREEAAAMPLAFDPTEKYETPRWWTNGEQLLYLEGTSPDRTGSYELYPGTNRYARPIERGRWWQQSYAALWLEPYAQYGTSRTRCSIRKIAEDFVLEVRSLEPMLGIGGPPPVVEDRLIGRWSGPIGMLRLDADLRYLLAPRPGGGAPAAVASQEGRWLVEAATIVLRPDSPTIEPRYLYIVEDDDAIVLETADGQLIMEPPLPGSNR